MKKQLKIWIVMTLVMLIAPLVVACGGDSDDEKPPVSDVVVINDDGTASNGSHCVIIDDKTLYLDYVKYSVVEGFIMVKGYDKDGFKGVANIASKITFKGNSYEVRLIGNRAFEHCNSLTSITIPNSVTEIGEGSFAGCSGLTSITIPNSVTEISGKAFTNCSGLTSIIIPHSVARIGSLAFYGCSGLTSVTIPSSVTWIGNGIFSGPSNLVSINVESGNSNYNSRNNCNAIIETSTNTLISGCQKTTIPNGVTTIGRYAFFNFSKLTTITIPNSVTKIDDEAFGSCNSLISIHCKCETPPDLHVGSFMSSNAYSSSTLYVPHGSIQKYQKADYWKLFHNIVEE